MIARPIAAPLLALAALFALAGSPAWAENEGQADLDKATELQIAAESLADLEKVADLCESALSKGLDESNKEFAVKLLTSTLYDHASKLSKAIFEQQHNQWPLLRTLAVKDLQRALKHDNNLPDAHFLLARLYVLPGGDREKAEKAVSQAIDLYKDNQASKSKALALRARLQDDADKQLADLSAAVEADPENVEAWQLRGLHYLGKEEDEKAVEDFKKALEIDAENLVTITGLAEALTKSKEYDEALKTIQRLIDASPDTPGGYTARARVHMLKGDDEKGLADLNKALELSPNDVPALLLRASHYYAKKQFDESKADIEKALAARPGAVQGILLRAILAAEQGDFKQAISDMELLVNADPTNTEWRSQLAQFYSANKQPRKAIETVEDILNKDEANVVARRIRGDAYLSIGKHAEAIADLEAAHKADPKNSGVLNNLAWVLATSPEDKLRDGKRSIELATQACEITDYKRPHILSTLAAGYAETGDWDNAIKWVKKAIEVAGETENEVVDHLKKELEHYEQKKPFRERQETEEKSEPSPDDLEI